MTDDSIQCILGRLEQSLLYLKEDLEEIKKEQKEISFYIANQKVGVRFLVTFLVFIGSTLTVFKDEIMNFLNGSASKIP